MVYQGRINSTITADHLSVPLKPDDLLLRLRHKDELLRSVAHDLRNPLAGIISLVDLVLDDAYEPREKKEMLSAIKEAAHHSLRLAQDLLTLGSPGNDTGESSGCSLHQVLQNCTRLLQFQFAKKHQQLELRLFEGKDHLAIEREKLARVLDNLISNAIKFTGDFGKVTISTQQMSNGIQIMIKDNGLGIAEAMQSKIFTGSKEAQRPGTFGEVSHGLGLPICKRIIEQSGGSITFQSKSGKGTIFYIWLPVNDHDMLKVNPNR